MNKDLGASANAEPGSRASTEPSSTVSALTGFDPARLSRAIEVAARVHRLQVDKGGSPYILHPLRVMFSVKRHGQDAMIAAVLHDVVEDGGIFLHDIAMTFGRAVADAVDALSRRKGESYDDFIERCGANDIAREVKCEDLSDNSDISRLRSVSAADWARVEKYSRAFDRLKAIATEGKDRP